MTNKKLKIFAVLCITFVCLIYLFFAFVKLSFDFSRWPEGMRLVAGLMVFGSFLMSAIISWDINP